MQKTTSRRGSPLPLILLLILLLGAVATITVINQRNNPVFDAHDHDQDGKPDHGSEGH